MIGLCSKKPVGQSGALGFPSGDAVARLLLMNKQDSRWTVVGGDIEGRECVT
jgi:hypothetical protein